jgi:hypothetical protein
VQQLATRRKASSVFRLVGAGPAGTSLIAKRCRRAAALKEWAAYRHALPEGKISTAPCVGFVGDTDPRFGWLFLADVGGEKYSPFVAEHRVLAGQWLATVHLSAPRTGYPPSLPRRGLAYYRGHLRSSRRRILSGLSHPNLTRRDRADLRSYVRRLDALERRWEDLEDFAARLPRTLVHGDLCPENVRVRRGRRGSELVVFDWADASWGIPWADLASLVGPAWTGLDLSRTFMVSSLHADSGAYWSMAAKVWRRLDRRDLRRVMDVSFGLHALAGISFEGWTLSYPYRNEPELRWLEEYLAFVRAYCAWLGSVMLADGASARMRRWPGYR